MFVQFNINILLINQSQFDLSYYLFFKMKLRMNTLFVKKKVDLKDDLERESMYLLAHNLIYFCTEYQTKFYLQKPYRTFTNPILLIVKHSFALCSGHHFN